MRQPGTILFGLLLFVIFLGVSFWFYGPAKEAQQLSPFDKSAAGKTVVSNLTQQGATEIKNPWPVQIINPDLYSADFPLTQAIARHLRSPDQAGASGKGALTGRKAP